MDKGQRTGNGQRTVDREWTTDKGQRTTDQKSGIRVLVHCPLSSVRCLLSVVRPLSLVLFILIGCGSPEVQSPEEIRFQESEGNVGYLQLNLSNTSGAITHYKIRIEGEGFETKEETLSKEAGGVAIQGIPAGKNRQIEVSALNNKGQTLREGILENVEIIAGLGLTLNIPLQAVPLVLNFQDGAYESNRRVFFSVLTDPGHRVGLRGEKNYADILSGSEAVFANGQGLARFYPGLLPAGQQAFEVIDFDSGKSSRISLRLWDGQAIAPAPLWAASATDTTVGGIR